MRIKQYPEFVCTVDYNPVSSENYRRRVNVTAVAIPWKDCEYVPAWVKYSSTQENYPFPVKILKRPKDWIFSRSALAIRTDVYPLLWVYVWLYLQVENLVYIAWCRFMWGCNRLGIARTKPGFEYNWKDLFWWTRKPQVTLPVAPAARTIEEYIFDISVFGCVGNLVPAFTLAKQSQPDCVGCKYSCSSSYLVCAVHPLGYEGDHCIDREAAGSDH